MQEETVQNKEDNTLEYPSYLRYSIKTIQDINTTVTSENINRFSADFIQYLKIVVSLKESGMFTDEQLPVSYDWIDDGKTETTISVSNVLNDTKTISLNNQSLYTKSS